MLTYAWERAQYGIPEHAPWDQSELYPPRMPLPVRLPPSTMHANRQARMYYSSTYPAPIQPWHHCSTPASISLMWKPSSPRQPPLSSMHAATSLQDQICSEPVYCVI